MEEEIQDTASLPPEIWDLGIHDAHCHPTDTPTTLHTIPSMNARTLTVMATRAWDQHRVADLAREHGIDKSSEGTGCKVVPSFGWHPWFSHMIADDLPDSLEEYYITHIIGGEKWEGKGKEAKSKKEHYTAVLTPCPPDEFVEQLPDPKPLSVLIAETKAYLEEFHSALVGEVGLDKTFRLPKDPRGWRADCFSEDLEGDQSGRKEDKGDNDAEGEHEDGEKPKMLSPYKVQPAHQKRLLEAQLRLAGALNRPVSVHGVGAHGVLLEVFQELWKGYEREVVSKRTKKRGPYDYQGDESTSDEDENEENHSNVKKKRKRRKGPFPFPPRVCLHSFSASPPFLRQWTNEAHPCEVFFSFSTAVNSRYGDKFLEVLKNVPEDRLLVESDLHAAGERMEGYLAGIVVLVSKVREWTLEETAKKVGANWGAFVFGKDGRGQRMEVRKR